MDAGYIVTFRYKEPHKVWRDIFAAEDIILPSFCTDAPAAGRMHAGRFIRPVGRNVFLHCNYGEYTLHGWNIYFPKAGLYSAANGLH